MTDYEALAQEIREKRKYHEAEDGTIFCSLSKCSGSRGLRCYRTGVPICQHCATRTPVGYLSQEANRVQQNQFFDAQLSDYILAGGAAFFANLIVGFFVLLIGGGVFGFTGIFGLLIIGFISASAAGAISEAVWRVLRKRRGRYTHRVIAGAIIVSSLLLLPFSTLFVWLIYTVVVTSTVYTRFQLGIRL